MKKLLLVFIFLLVGTGTSVYATPFLDGNGFGNVYTISIEGTERSYEVGDYKQKDDEWDPSVGGYAAYSGLEPLNYDYYTFTGYYLGTVIDDGTSEGATATNVNDKEYIMRDLISYYLGVENYAIDRVSTDDGLGLSTDPTVFKDGDEAIGGTWSYSSPFSDSSGAVNFYTVKASNSFALYYVDPVAIEGVWTTAHNPPNNDKGRDEPIDNNPPEISHLSANITDAPAPVPEPATLFLFGVGLVGLAGVRRKIAH